jgi:hypothetical protein
MSELLVQVQVQVLTPPTGCKASTCLRLHRGHLDPVLGQVHSIDCRASIYWKLPVVHAVRVPALVDFVHWGYREPDGAAVD